MSSRFKRILIKYISRLPDPLDWIFVHYRQHFVIIAALLTGLITGFAAIIIKNIVHFVYVTFSEVSIVNNYKFLLTFLPLLGLLLTVAITKIFFKGNTEKGLHRLFFDIENKKAKVPSHKTWSQIITAGVTIGLGGSSGLEGPMAVTGSAIGSDLAKRYQLSHHDRLLLLASGAAAAISATFNAPIAGVIFAFEVILAGTTSLEFIPLIAASVTGALVAQVFMTGQALFNFRMMEHFNSSNVPFYIFMGIILGFVSIYYSRSFLWSTKAIEKAPVSIWLKAIIGGLLLGSLYLLFPSLFGEGYTSIKLIADGKLDQLYQLSLMGKESGNETLVLAGIGLMAMIKVFATSITLNCGGNGGNFAPTLFVGAFIGFLFARLINLSGMAHVPESNFTLVGMSGVLSGVFFAPLTAIFLIAELTGGYDLIIPLMIVSSISFFITRQMDHQSLERKKYELINNA